MPIGEDLIHSTIQSQECLHFWHYPVRIKVPTLKVLESHLVLSIEEIERKDTYRASRSESRLNVREAFKTLFNLSPLTQLNQPLTPEITAEWCKFFMYFLCVENSSNRHQLLVFLKIGV